MANPSCGWGVIGGTPFCATAPFAPTNCRSSYDSWYYGSTAKNYCNNSSAVTPILTPTLTTIPTTIFPTSIFVPEVPNLVLTSTPTLKPIKYILRKVLIEDGNSQKIIAVNNRTDIINVKWTLGEPELFELKGKSVKVTLYDETGDNERTFIKDFALLTNKENPIKGSRCYLEVDADKKVNDSNFGQSSPYVYIIWRYERGKKIAEKIYQGYESKLTFSGLSSGLHSIDIYGQYSSIVSFGDNTVCKRSTVIPSSISATSVSSNLTCEEQENRCLEDINKFGSSPNYLKLERIENDISIYSNFNQRHSDCKTKYDSCVYKRNSNISCQMPQLPLKMPVLVLEYFPPNPISPNLLDGIETGWKEGATIDGRTIKFWEDQADKMVNVNINVLNESTKYHGYKDPNAVQFLDYYVLENKKFYEPFPRGYPVGFDKNGNRNYSPDYRKILDNLNICDYVNNKGVKEIWIYGYHNNSTIVPDESRMSSKYADVSNSLPKEDRLPKEFRLPVCNSAYTLYNFNYVPKGDQEMANNIHNRLHQIENIVPFIENKWPPIREDRVNSNIKNSIFWGDFSEYNQDYTKRDAFLSSCGNSHASPNWNESHREYTYSNEEKGSFDCENWNPDPSKTVYITAGCERWGCTDLGFYKWWMQNLPGYNNGIIYNGQPMRNWWEAVYDFNAFIEKGRSLYGDSIFCSAKSFQASQPSNKNAVYDLNEDGVVNCKDSQIFTSKFVKKEFDESMDFNNNGAWDGEDLNGLLRNYTPGDNTVCS